MADCALPACRRTVSDAWVCAPCAATIAGRLQAAAELWPDLLTTCAGQARMGEPGPRARGHAPPQPIRPGLGDPAEDHQGGPPTGLPFGWTASDVRDSVRNTVTTWVRHIVAERPTGMLLGTTPTLLRWLAGQCEWLRHQPYGAEALDELDDAVGMVAPAVDRPAMRTRVAVGPCPEVDCAGQVTALVPARLDIPAVMRCDGCGSEWGAQQWARVGRRIMARMEMMGGMTLVEFLRARLDEDERQVEGSGRIAWLTYRNADGSMHHTTVAAAAGDEWVIDGQVATGWASADVIYNESRVLAEVEAKRWIVELCEAGVEPHAPATPGVRAGYRAILRYLAAPYADHPDYDPAWRP